MISTNMDQRPLKCRYLIVAVDIHVEPLNLNIEVVSTAASVSLIFAGFEGRVHI